MSKKIADLDLHSKEVDDLLGKVPSWIILNGIVMVVVVLMVLVAGSWFFKYPDIITAPVVISADPQNISTLHGIIQLKVDPTGKVKIGQQVNMKFSSYPYLKYGMVKGTVSKICNIPNGDVYKCELSLPASLYTTSGINLAFDQELQGTAEIVTDARSLLSRILSPVGTVTSER